MAGADFGPAQNLRFGGSGKPAREPFDDERIEAGKNIWRNRGKNFNHLPISLTYFSTELHGTGGAQLELVTCVVKPHRA